MMKKISAGSLQRALLCAGLLFVFLFAGALPARAEYDIAGRWQMQGTGYGDKSGVRTELELRGYLDIRTQIVDGQRCVSGYNMKIRIDASKLNIKVWDKTSTEELRIPVPLPELRPTMSNPFNLPPVKTKDGLIYEVILQSVSSGLVKIYGTLDLDIIGVTKFDSNSVIWKEGTERPADYKDMRSGCSLGGWGMAGLLLSAYVALRGRIL